jgi:hypothetical protein
MVTRDARRTVNPQQVLAAISWILLVTVMFGGYSLLMLITSGDGLTDHEEQFFRAGHAHAGVLAAIGILYSNYIGRTRLAARTQVIAWLVYLAGVLLQSGGMFVHMIVGEPEERSPGTWMTIGGGVLLAVSVLFLAWHLYRARDMTHEVIRDRVTTADSDGQT